jgi:aminoglycoside 6'-N-acetyltransferase
MCFDKFNPAELAGIDLFIADENHLRTSYSSNVLKTFINKYLKNDFKAVLVDPDKNNITAIKFFGKNGFTHILSQDEQHYLMIKNIGEDTQLSTILLTTQRLINT